MTDPVRVSCHCGAVQLRVRLKDGLTTAMRCDCSYCRRRGAIMVAVDEADLEVLRSETLAVYRFGTGTAEHFFCARCGNTTHNRRRSYTRIFGVNAGGIEGVDVRALEPVWFDGVNHPSDRREGA